MIWLVPRTGKKVYRRAKSEENGNGDNGETSSDSDSQEQQADCSEDELLNEETGGKSRSVESLGFSSIVKDNNLD